MTNTEMLSATYGRRKHSATQRCGVLILVACSLLGQLWTTAVHAEVLELEGTVKAIDSTARTITIERKTPKGTKTLELEVNKKAGDLANVKVGDRIAFSYDPALELVTRLGSGQGKPAQPQDAAHKASPASKGPGEREKEICQEVCRKLEQEHFLEPRIDRDLASKMLDTFLRSIDPMKMYFLQSDIDSLKKEAGDLPSALKEGNVTVAYTIYRRFVERVESCLPEIEALISQSHDFTKDESVDMDQASTRWAKTAAEAKDKWRRRIKYDLLTGKMQGEKDAALKERLLRRYRSFSTRWKQMTSDELLEMFLSSLYSSVDGLSQYMSPETLVNFEIGMRRQLDGIGAQLKGEDGLVIVVELTPGGAAFKDGRLKPGDRIVGIAQGNDGDFVDVQDMRLNEVVDLVRGKRGTVVRLKVLSSGNSTPKVYDITRSKIELKAFDVSGEVFGVGRKTDGSPRRVGVVKIPNFYRDMDAMRRGDKGYKSASNDCKALLEGFQRQQVDGVVVDVRDNGGGFADEFAACVGLFIDRGRVFQIKQRGGKVETFDDKDDGASWSGPLVVLVNRHTAGGAELFAGAIQDHHRGIIVGDEATTGVAANLNVIQVAPTKQLGAVKMLWALMYRPSGEGVHGKGIRSDVVLPSVTDAVANRNESEGKPMVIDRLGREGFSPARQDLGEVAGSLQKKSAARVAKDPQFQDLEKLLRRLEGRLQSQSVSLKESEFDKQWKEGQRDGTSLAADDRREPLKRDFYLDEVLSIAGDLSDEFPDK